MANDLITTSDPAIASFDYNDIADGRGVVIHYLWSGQEDGGTSVNAISTATPYSASGELSTGSTSPVTWDFYTGAFSAPRVVDGDVMFSFFWYNQDGGGGTITLKLYHYDGTTSTQIGTTFTEANHTSHSIKNILFNVSNQKFKRGDQIRLEIALSIGAGGTTAVGIDPQNEDWTFIKPTQGHTTSTSWLRVPFRIDR